MRAPIQRIAEMNSSGIRDLMARAAQVPDAVHLEVGEPSFTTPRHVIDAAFAASVAGHTHYSPECGIPELRQALAEKIRRVNGYDAPASRVIVTHGAMGALMTAFSALLDAGDEILLPDPGWINWDMAAITRGADIVRYPLLADGDPREGLEGLTPDFTALERLVTPRTRALLVNSPSNPTGGVMSRATLARLMDFARVHDLWVVSDECYDELTYGGPAAPSPALFDTDGRVVTVYSFSKTYAMTGWRIGYAVAPEALFEPMAKLQEPLICVPSTAGQHAALAALAGPREPVTDMLAAYTVRRDRALAELADQGLACTAPSGAFYLWADVSGVPLDAYAFAVRLLDEERLAVAPGTAFGPGGAGRVRLSLAADLDDVVTGVRRLGSFVARHAPVAVPA